MVVGDDIMVVGDDIMVVGDDITIPLLSFIRSSSPRTSLSENGKLSPDSSFQRKHALADAGVGIQ